MTFREEIKRPYNVITLILTILSISLSIIFYFKSTKEKSLSYQLNQPSSLIYDNKNSFPSLKMYEKDTIPIDGNVYLLTGSIWNSGDISFDKSDVRLPLTIVLKKSNRILDFKITKQKDESFAKFNLSNLSPNSLKIGWNYFDPGFGFNFQIIYLGEEDANFELNGKILDVETFNNVIKPERKSIKERLLWILLAVFNLLMTILLLYGARRKKLAYKIFITIILIIFLLNLLYMIWLYFINKTQIPI